ncbi:MAG: hypothetical protein ACE5I5_17575 [Candidatus Heimdallarchaeota archaeon]
MSQYKAVGSHIQLIFQTKFPTFTPDQFSKALKDKNYIMVQSQISNPQNPQAPPIRVQIFSKENVNVFLVQNKNQIVFQILNTVNLKTIYQEISRILLSLNVLADIILNIGFNFTTKSPAKTEPQKNLTSLVKGSFLKGIAESVGTNLRVFSIRLATAFPLGKEGLQVILEPLGTSPRDEYYLNIIYQTTKMDEFNVFVGNFGEDMIQEIIKEVEENV